MPAAAGSGRGPNYPTPQPQPLTFTFHQHQPVCIKRALPRVAHLGQTQAFQSFAIYCEASLLPSEFMQACKHGEKD